MIYTERKSEEGTTLDPKSGKKKYFCWQYEGEFRGKAANGMKNDGNNNTRFKKRQIKKIIDCSKKGRNIIWFRAVVHYLLSKRCHHNDV